MYFFSRCVIDYGWRNVVKSMLLSYIELARMNAITMSMDLQMEFVCYAMFAVIQFDMFLLANGRFQQNPTISVPIYHM